MNTERQSTVSATAVSIIMPVLNEGPGLVDALAALQRFRHAGAEIVVVDGGSGDDSIDSVRPLSDRIIVAARGRGHQMNMGAAVARGRILLFLHADTRLPSTAIDVLLAAAAGGAQWGRFDVRIDGDLAGLRLVAFFMNWRSRLTGIATGDQAIFAAREAFFLAGGFPEIALMEDVDFSRKMRRRSPPACLREKVETSGRRWLKYGLLRTILLMWQLRLRFFFGADPNDLARSYGYLSHE